MEIRMPENAKKVIETLEAAGYEAYIVGGCVRDSISGKVQIIKRRVAAGIYIQ